ncbi:hypothetical protein MTR_8g099810 [Medicago truncatula]|uniref:Uncharacterized protein n=1 Tax=Medicago truncatula TaxID=3880 RepID=G7LI37_MEDTR|nr:hypothetical protein MTR_8g099810 [Medicago truncatula]
MSSTCSNLIDISEHGGICKLYVIGSYGLLTIEDDQNGLVVPLPGVPHNMGRKEKKNIRGRFCLYRHRHYKPGLFFKLNLTATGKHPILSVEPPYTNHLLSNSPPCEDNFRMC